MPTGSDFESTERGSAAREEPPSPDKRSLDLQHAATIGAAALLVFALLKAYAAARFSLTTAGALLTTAPIDMLLGTMVSYSYEVFPLLGFAAIAWAWAHTFKTGKWNGLTTAACLFAALAIMVSPLGSLVREAVTLAATVACYILVSWLARYLTSDKFREGKRPKRSLFVAPAARPMTETAFLVAAFLIIYSTLTNLWLPEEVLVYQQQSVCKVGVTYLEAKGPRNKPVAYVEANGCQKTVAHVLSVDDHWTSFVRESDRALRRVPTDDVKFRELCHQAKVQPPGQQAIWWRFDKGASYKSPNTDCDYDLQNVHGAALDLGS